MTFPEDSTAPAAFTGDSDVFDLPDAFLQTPITTERVVDTQSGFLVVIKRLNERVSISVKRRLGTPPSSSVLLTPDESLKLSRILATSITADELHQEQIPRNEMRRRLLSRGEQPGAFTEETRDAGYEQLYDSRLDEDGRDQRETADLEQEALAGVAAARARRREQRFSLPAISSLTPKTIMVSGAVALALAVTGICAGFLLTDIFGGASKVEKVADAASPLTQSKIDRFARMYVSDLLDFNPETYKVSQIQAMSHMSQPLLERYWKETGFPLSTRQLKALPQNSTVMITSIQQKRIDEESAEVDIFAQLVQPNSKDSSPVRLNLKLGTTTDGTIRVIEQQDISADAPSPQTASPATNAEQASASKKSQAPAPAATTPAVTESAAQTAPAPAANQRQQAAPGAQTQPQPTEVPDTLPAD